MNYSQTYKIESEFKSKGYSVELSSSAASDYIKITNPADQYGFKFVVRISDHDAMTGRSACADLSYTTTEMFNGEFDGKFLSRLGFDGADFDTTGDFEYTSESERDEAIAKAMIAEIISKLDF